MSKPISYTYDRRQSPLLPMAEGHFRFLHSSNDRIHGVAERTLEVAQLGSLVVASGWLTAGDPFISMTRSGLRRVAAPAGAWPVFQTLCNQGVVTPASAPRAAYLSIVFDQEMMNRRQAWQRRQLMDGFDPRLPLHALRVMPLTASGTGKPVDGEEDDIEDADDEFPGILVESGTAAMVDPVLFENGMPPDSAEAGRGWYDTLFEHGMEGSWFDFMDSPAHYRVGAANFPLPRQVESPHGRGNIILTQSGWGDGRYLLLAEYRFDYEDEDPRIATQDHSLGAGGEAQLVAYHLDFQVVPFDPLRPPFELR